MTASPTPQSAVSEAVAHRRVSHLAGTMPALASILGALASAALVVFLMRRLFLDGHRLDRDFRVDAFYIRLQAAALRDGHAPSLFMSTGNVGLYPLFAFYGGTLFTFAAMLSVLTGQSPVVAEAATYTLALAAAYGGWYWLARQAGAHRWLAHAPAIVFVTASYTITNIYARQDLPEVVATNAMPLMVAAAISVARADRLRAGPTAALALATIAYSGSHNLTLLYGTVFLVLLAAIVVVAVPEARRCVSRTGVLRVLAVCLPAVAVNAWFLLPDLFYSHDTTIAQHAEAARAMLRVSSPEVSLGHLLSPGRPDSQTGSGYALPILAGAWALLAIAVARPVGRMPWRRLVVVFLGVVLGIAVLMAHVHVLAGLPRPWIMLQSAARLDTFAVFGICGMLIAALAATPVLSRWLTILLAAVLVVGCVQAAGQVGRAAVTEQDVQPLKVADGVIFSTGDFADASLPVIRPAPNTSFARLSPQDFDGNRADFAVSERPGGLVLTNLMAPGRMLRVEGGRIVGRWNGGSAYPGWQPRWYLALQVDPNASGNQHRIVIEPARTFPIVAGRVISFLGLLGLLGLATVIALRRARLRPPAPRLRRRSAAAP